ncbi:CRISPR system precrRNA processing endoribonuclease RAMP protein Cas6 [Nocardiopsis aegyptia]|uniref:CRISPR-associated endoribonuclease Cas6 n=1 Tax=Nocardiopsis aegyptia TaxID=220378 RepID=A0A7Z0EIS0_9ACTN|nr:CRISPR system precrRNA processing endoribonuclease RAMP protein Cas6 [Nocardiopsis aegyptia]NYJ32855.1 CRISPR-associated endoribonuclease Cas6 [Nocardiopsis aegyptia]
MPTWWTLTPTPPPHPSVSPSHLHALACHLLETPASDHTAQTKPFSTALAPITSTATPGTHLVVAWLDEPTEPDLARRLATPVRLGPRTIRLNPVDRHTQPYTRLAACPPAPKARVEFTTPAYVKRGKRQMPLPEPELLLTGLARRWAAYSPQPLPPAAVTEMLETVHLARHDIRTLPAGSGPHQRTGFVGHAVFALPPGTSRAAQRAFAALWTFAEFSGVGAQTTHGLGHVRVRLPGPRTEHAHRAVREGNTNPTGTARTRAGHPHHLPQNEDA